MIENRSFDILDYIILVLKKKKIFISLTIFLLAASYLTIYFFVPVEWRSRSLVVLSESDQTGGIASLMRSITSLPVSVPGLKTGSDTDVFTTIIYSRTNLEKVIQKFGLFEEYGDDTMEETVKELTDNIKADETKQGAYEIYVTASSPQKAADMANYIVDLLNTTLIDLNISKSRDNRIFLEKRYDDVKNNLKAAEDSLVFYQKKSGIFYAEDQAKSSFEAYAKLEAELASKQIEYSVLEKLYGKTSPLVESAGISVKEYESKLNDIKSGKDKNGIILALKNLPANAMNYLRYYRDVEIYNKMLTFIIPLFEQARFDEQKNIPVLKVIDKGVPAEKKAFPPRTLLSIAFTLIILLIVFFVMVLKERLGNSKNPKILIARNYLFSGKKQS